MIWNSENMPSQRVQGLLEAFHCFIQDNHRGNKEEDIFVREQWQKFKSQIQLHPFDITAHQNHIDKINKDTSLAVDIKLTKSVQNLASSVRKAGSKKQMPVKQLQKIASKLADKMKEHNRKYIK